MEWIDVNIQLPTCYQSGDWDGFKSDLILAETIDGKKILCECYEGFIDGVSFFDWYQVDTLSKNDWTVTEPISRWINIPF